MKPWEKQENVRLDMRLTLELMRILSGLSAGVGFKIRKAELYTFLVDNFIVRDDWQEEFIRYVKEKRASEDSETA